MKRDLLVLVVVLFLAQFVSAGDKATKQTIEYVQKLQTPSGGFRPHEPKPDAVKILPTLRATSAAVRTLKYLGGELPNKDACIKFVESCYDAKSGGFSDTSNSKPDVFTTAVGLMAVVELKMPIDKFAPAAVNYLSENAKSFEEIRIAVAGFEAIKGRSTRTKEWIREAEKGMKRNGSFGEGGGIARDTASHVVSLMRLGEKATLPDSVLNTLKSGQRQNGGWGKADSEIASDLETTYRVMRCFMMLKAKPDNAEGVRSFIAKCRNADGGYAVMPGQPSNVSGTYFAAIILHWLKD